MTKEDFKCYRHFTFKELLLILKNLETTEEMNVFMQYIQKFRKTLSLLDLKLIHVFCRDKRIKLNI